MMGQDQVWAGLARVPGVIAVLRPGERVGDRSVSRHEGNIGDVSRERDRGRRCDGNSSCDVTVAVKVF